MRLTVACLVSATALLLLAGPLDAEAQPARKVATVGYLSGGFAASAYHPTFVSGLRYLGYVR